MSIRASLRSRSWSKDNYLISTDSSILPLDKVNEVLDDPDVYWAKSLPKDALSEMIDNSLCFGLYEKHGEKESSLEFLGMGRCITDFVSFIYLTDVWVRPDQQGKGLGTWLILCVENVIEEMPSLRRSMLFTSDWDRSVPFYRKHLKMSVFGGAVAESERSDPAMLQFKGPGAGPGKAR